MRDENWTAANWNGRGWSGNWGRHNHRFSNDVVFIGDFGFPGWWGWGYPYGYYGYGYDELPIRLLWLWRRIRIRTGTVTMVAPGYGYPLWRPTYLRGHVSQSGRHIESPTRITATY